MVWRCDLQLKELGDFAGGVIVHMQEDQEPSLWSMEKSSWATLKSPRRLRKVVRGTEQMCSDGKVGEAGYWAAEMSRGATLRPVALADAGREGYSLMTGLGQPGYGATLTW
jgi:hypothetical protein